MDRPARAKIGTTAMRRYFFDLSDGGWEPDRIGTELRDDDAAQHEAIRFAGEVLKHEPGRLQRGEVA